MTEKYIICTLIYLLFCTIEAQSQCTKTATLTRSTIYNTEGTAFLEELEDGRIQLRLGEDFLADDGPDVNIYLANDSTSVTGGKLIADITERSHFSGATTFEITDDIDINDYTFVVFRCLLFDVYWGGGRLSASSCDGGTDPDDGMGEMPMENSCMESLVSTTAWVDEVTICPNDGMPDVIPLMNNAFIPAGEAYAYIIVDGDSEIQQVVLQDSLDFEGSDLETAFVYGVSYSGDLSATVGSQLSMVSAGECAIISGASSFLTVLKEDCSPASACTSVSVATTAWVSEVTICPTDGEPDVIPFMNNQFIESGDAFAYLLTDVDDNLLQVMEADSFDFEGTGTETNRIYGISYGGVLDFEIDSPISEITATGCVQLSDSALYLTILKGGCVVASTFSISGSIMTPAGDPVSGVEIMDGEGEVLSISNDQGMYMITSADQGSEYALSPRSLTPLTNGVSSVDVVIISRHLLSTATISDPYALIAADIDNNGAISAVDLVQMIRAIVGLSESFNNNAAWRFIDAGQSLSADQFNPELRESISITVDNDNVTGVDFIGIKVGDVNANASLDLK